MVKENRQNLIHNLIDLTSKSQHFLLNLGPSAEGRIPQAPPLGERDQPTLKITGQPGNRAIKPPDASTRSARHTRSVLPGSPSIQTTERNNQQP